MNPLIRHKPKVGRTIQNDLMMIFIYYYSPLPSPLQFTKLGSNRGNKQTSNHSLLYPLPHLSFFSHLLNSFHFLKTQNKSNPMNNNTTNSPFFLYYFFFFIIIFPIIISSLPDPDPETIQPLVVSTTSPSPPATIPAFPEQSNVAGCPLDLPEDLFHSVKSACTGGHLTTAIQASSQLTRSRCCPVLATWLYAAYSATALGREATETATTPATRSVDLPLLPDDSETCVDDLGKAMKQRGIELPRPNETCDVVYCYCGIRLHPLTCPEAFSLNPRGKLVGNVNVRRLERHCLSSSNNVNGFPGLGGCNKCLNTLYQVISLIRVCFCSSSYDINALGSL